MAEKKKGSYTADDIQVLEGLEPVRKRPGMYIGSTGTSGLHHLIKEIFDNSRDEAMGGYADHIEIALLPDGFVRVVDNGRGIPVGKHKKTGVSALETIMTTLHAGGKFDSGGGYAVAGGLHGVGASVVNALSVYAMVEVHQEGAVYRQEYAQGKKKADVKKVGKTSHTGTTVLFCPDPEIFSSLEFSWPTIVAHYREQAYLVPGTRITLVDARQEKKVDFSDTYYVRALNIPVPSLSFYFEGGIQSMVRFYNRTQKPVHKRMFHVHKQLEDHVEVEVAFQYIDDISSNLIGFANNIMTPGGGTHITGFKTALTRNLNVYNKNNKIIPEKEGAFMGEDVLEGLTAVVSMKLPPDKIQFEGQTKDKLGTPEARGWVETVFSEALDAFLEENPDDARDILKKATLALRARKAAKAAKDSILRKGVLEGMTLPGKLADCSTRKAENAELFIVEGESAGGTAKMGRDRNFQAILPLRGKILNVERARLDKMIANNEIKNLVIALGTSISDTFDIEKLRYHKVIIATDADVDGAHIRTLALTLFFRYFRDLIEGGFIYVAEPPLYKITKGKDVRYAYSEEEKNVILGEFGGADAILPTSDDDDSLEEEEIAEEVESKKKNVMRVNIQRYKGLGEMNSDELWETTMNPATRTLKQIGVQDAQLANQTFETLMGTDVASRKAFIQSNAKTAELDI